MTEAFQKRDHAREKDYATYLIPSPGETNRFFLSSRMDPETNTISNTFYVGSSSRQALEAMGTYFFLCYNLAARSIAPQRLDGPTTSYVSAKKKNVKAMELQETGFIRSVSYLPFSMDNLLMDYEVIIVSHSFRKRTKFSFMVKITLSGGEEEIRNAQNAMGMKFMELYHSIGIKLKPVKKRIVAFRKGVYGIPFKLTTFVAIPTDEEA